MKKRCLYVFVLIVILLFSTTPCFAGNSFIVTDLRTDLPIVAGALDFRVAIRPMLIPGGNHPGGYTTGWISVDLDNQPGLYGAKFTQIGLMTDPERGVFWFVFSEAPISCLSGTPFWWHDDVNRFFGCRGNPNTLVSLGQYSTAELVTYGGGVWIARIISPIGQPLDVALISSNSATIFDATICFEEAYTETIDPHMSGQFYFWHPQYMIWGYGFTDWIPSLGEQINSLYSVNLDGINDFCPIFYGATLFINGDHRNWFTGTGGIICTATVFPPENLYLSILIKDQ